MRGCVWRSAQRLPRAPHSAHCRCHGCCEMDVLLLKVLTPRLPGPPPVGHQVSWGSQVEEDRAPPCPRPIRSLAVCLPHQETCHEGEWQSDVCEVCCLLMRRPLGEAPSFQTGSGVRKDVTLEARVGPHRRDFVTSLWGEGVVIIWMPRLSRGNPFGGLITLERARSQEDRADKVH